ncbi:hypothetical protein Tco_0690535 [Tanacetum coccineum]
MEKRSLEQKNVSAGVWFRKCSSDNSDELDEDSDDIFDESSDNELGEMLNVFYANGHLSTNMQKIPGICSPDAAFFFGKRNLVWFAFLLGTHASPYDMLTLHFWLRSSLWLQFKPHQTCCKILKYGSYFVSKCLARVVCTTICFEGYIISLLTLAYLDAARWVGWLLHFKGTEYGDEASDCLRMSAKHGLPFILSIGQAQDIDGRSFRSRLENFVSLLQCAVSEAKRRVYLHCTATLGDFYFRITSIPAIKFSIVGKIAMFSVLM